VRVEQVILRSMLLRLVDCRHRRISRRVDEILHSNTIYGPGMKYETPCPSILRWSRCVNETRCTLTIDGALSCQSNLWLDRSKQEKTGDGVGCRGCRRGGRIRRDLFLWQDDTSKTTYTMRDSPLQTQKEACRERESTPDDYCKLPEMMKLLPIINLLGNGKSQVESARRPAILGNQLATCDLRLATCKTTSTSTFDLSQS
jgi:hypothetical protein